MASRGAPTAARRAAAAVHGSSRVSPQATRCPLPRVGRVFQGCEIIAGPSEQSGHAGTVARWHGAAACEQAAVPMAIARPSSWKLASDMEETATPATMGSSERKMGRVTWLGLGLGSGSGLGPGLGLGLGLGLVLGLGLGLGLG